MKMKLLLAGLTAVGMLVGCGDDDDNNVTPVPPSSQDSGHPWQQVLVNAECDETSDPSNLCNEGATTLAFNSDGSFNFNNGMRTGSLSADDLERLVAVANPIASQDTVQQQSCEDSQTNVLLAYSIAMTLTGASEGVVVYEERDDQDQVCTRGNQDRLLDLRELLAKLAIKYSVTTTPTPSPTPTPEPQPTATP